MSIKYSELFSILQMHGENFKDYKTLLKCVLLKKEFNFFENAELYLTTSLKNFSTYLYKRWCKSKRTHNVFMKQNESWLQTLFYFPEESLNASLLDRQCEPSTSTNLKQKPNDYSYKRKSFLDLSEKQKRRRSTSLMSKYTVDELASTLKVKFETSGDIDKAKVLCFLMKNPEESSKLKDFCEGKRFEVKTYSGKQALALTLNLDLSRSKYEELRHMSNVQGITQYPSYYQVKLAKKDCYPSKETITVTDTHASIKLQALLDLTVCRLIEAYNIDTCFEKRNLKLISKWGFDGASCQSFYKQAFKSDDFDKPRDDSIFVTCLVPLKLVHDSTIIWENVKPSSTRYCRPIKFEFVKENDEVIRRENQRMSDKIQTLISTCYNGISVEHQLLLTMVDGKICSSLTESSSMSCFICGVTPKNMNNFELICQREVKNVEYYKFGMSSLHARKKMVNSRSAKKTFKRKA